MNFDTFLSTLPDPVRKNIEEEIKRGSSFTAKTWITAQEADDKIERLMPLRDYIADKFKSGNGVPIERIVLRREEIEQFVFGVEPKK